MIITPSQMKAAEEAAFAEGVSPEDLIKIAGEEIAEVIRQFYPGPATVIVFCGKGNNAGDALVAARDLHSWGWNVLLRLTAAPEEMSPLARRHLSALPKSVIFEELPKKISGKLLLIDGLLGIGSAGAPRGAIANGILEMNHLRRLQGGFSVAIDLPSGLDGSTGAVNDPCIQADLTVTLGFVKSGLLADAATNVVGRLALVPLSGLSCETGDEAELITVNSLRALLPNRHFDTHKGIYGRIGMLAGSRGMLGAARLSSAAAVHAGGGLVTLFTLPENYESLAALCVPEVMVQPVDSYLDLLGANLDVIGLGPGLGEEHHRELRTLIKELSFPCVVDADALNALAIDISLLNQVKAARLLTPHPGEMERLSPRNARTRRAWAEDFASNHPVTLLLKGARTVIAEKDQVTAFNSTGNPGMASGGMGDVLTGVCAALIGSGHSLRDAAMLGAWLCGRAAEQAISSGEESQESLSAGILISRLGRAANDLRSGCY